MPEETEKKDAKILVRNIHRGPVFIPGRKEYLAKGATGRFTAEELAPLKGKGYVEKV